MGDLVADVLATLDLHDVVLVGNDTGGVVAQLVAVHHPERLGALVLTSCDAFEHFPPPILKPVILAAKSKKMFRPLFKPCGRRRPAGAPTATLPTPTSMSWRSAGYNRRSRIRRSPKTCVS
ncbi:alpha/beta hydrolase family protein [Mycobacterium ulcerans str. Harvey]|uniref:Alpha/beta hydrolase family protein n=1 Tax=Mycobacterium ulcerans str. Harvey TaxID=1299332 RepID=A0ABN0QTN9_MYCUL|nr:alpha/beta hydrolase family protein [Mycobacterium ulcerans str. Harvey]